MADDLKNELQDESQEASDSVVEDNPSSGAEQDPQSAEGNEAEAGTAPGDVKSIDPQNQTFWEDSVDANSVDLSEGETSQEETTKEDENDSTATPSPFQEEEGKGEGDDQPAEQEPVAAQDSEQEETPKAEEAPAAETEPAEDTTTAEETSHPEAGEQETPTAKTEETEDVSTTPPPQEEEKSEGESQSTEQDPLASQKAGQEEIQTDTEAPDTESGEPQETGKVISIYKYLRKKGLLTGIGILLLVAGSIGYAVFPGLRSPGIITSTLLGGAPESAYNMKFFLPLNVGYEKAQFVKVTIALELMDEGLQKEIDKNLAHLRKEVIDLILTKSPKEVRRAGGKKELSREITRRINNYLSKDCIKKTYFTELVIL